MKNIRFNDLTGYINVCCFAVGASHGSVQFTANSDAHNRVVSLLLTPSQEPTVDVRLTSLDQLLQEAGATPLVWKVDVESYEPEVLLDAAAALQHPHQGAVVLEAYNPALQLTMEQAGFARYSYHFFSRTLSPASVPGSSGGHNQIWIRDLPFVQ